MSKPTDDRRLRVHLRVWTPNRNDGEAMCGASWDRWDNQRSGRYRYVDDLARMDEVTCPTCRKRWAEANEQLVKGTKRDDQQTQP